MKKILNLTLICTFLFQSYAFADDERKYQSSFFDTINEGAEFDPVRTLNSSKAELEHLVLSIFTSERDQDFFKLKMKEAGKFPKNFKAKYENNNIVVEFLNKKMTFSNIDPVSKTFMLGEAKVELEKIKTIEELYKVFSKIDKPFVSSYEFAPSKLIFNEAHALGPFALGFIAFTLTSAAIASTSQMKKNLDQLERKIRDAEGICFSLDYGTDYNDTAAIEKFERISRGIYSRASNGNKQKVKKLTSCKQVKDSWWEWAKSWFYSIFAMTKEDIRDRIVELCERSVKVDKCIHSYKNRGRVNNDNRDPSDPRYRVYERTPRKRSAGAVRQ